MKEHATKEIRLEQFSAKQLRFFSRLLYTGQVASEDWEGAADERPPLDLILAATSLSKTYQVEGFLPLMLERLKALLTDSNFEDVMQFAINLDIAPLRFYCVKYAEKSNAIEKKYQNKKFAPEVLFELMAIWPAEPTAQKRRRQ